ncbi:hypothetical protein [Pseudalkalibacillus caeni]|uniref:Group-specific protein n=1 Tax=Exobacillus caeni TaxID=2574798 RepID=A0A5R9EYE5_9BACL|nr:hypothetical protein [Pseudalkalibacillus caeni]TLS35871.1 hypothetical protein FCL54_17895 [Pseudalkalibacillus caeni]
MFDPTIFENLKVVLEGSVYDLDLDGVILVTNRKDLVDLATMSRSYMLEFHSAGDDIGRVSIELSSKMANLGAEIMNSAEEPGCELNLRFFTTVNEVHRTCSRIHESLNRVWDGRPTISQTLSFLFTEEAPVYENDIRLQFGRKITEDQIDDFPFVIELALSSLEEIAKIVSR